MSAEHLFPPIQSGMSQIVSFADRLDGHLTIKVQTKDVKNERKGEMSVWNNEIRNDSMGVVAGTSDTKDSMTPADELSICNVNQISLIVGIRAAFSSGTARRAALALGLKCVHKVRKKLIR